MDFNWDPLYELQARVSQHSLFLTIPVGLVATVVLIIAVNLLQQLIYRLIFPYRAPIVPYLFPWIGSAVVYGMAPYEFFASNREKYGDVFAFVMCGRVMTVCLGPRGHDFVFNAKLNDVSAEEAYKHLTTPVFGEGVIYDCSNARLMEQKKFAKAALTRDAFRTYVPKIVNEVTQYIANRLPKPSEKVEVLEVTPEITIYTASSCLMGKEMRDKFSKRTAQLYSDLDKGFKPLNFVFPNLPLPYYKRRDEAHDEIQRQYMEVIRSRRKTDAPGEYNRDVIDAIMNTGVYRDGVKMTDEEIANLCIGVLMGGQHTSATTSAWALLHLAQQPEYQEMLFAEQQKVLGGNEELSYDDLQEMPLLNAVIRETLRLHSPLHSIFRKVMRPLAVPGTKYTVPKGHYVMVSPGFTHTNDEWFKESARFYPERWLNEEEVEKLTNRSKEETVDYGFGAVTKGASSPFLPFGAGRHRCIGEQFAMCQLGTILSTFVRELKWTLPKGVLNLPEPDYESMVVLPKEPADIVYTPRN